MKAMLQILSAGKETMPSLNHDGEWQIFKAFFICLLVAGILDGFLGDYTLAKLRRKDTLEKKVRLRRFGIIWLACIQLILLVILWYSLYVKSVTLGALFLIVFIAHGIYTIGVLSTRIEITEATLVYKTIFQTRIIDTSVIYKACWVSKGRSFGYTLVLKLTNGRSVEFPQIYFVGLNDLWERFSDGE